MYSIFDKQFNVCIFSKKTVSRFIYILSVSLFVVSCNSYQQKKVTNKVVKKDSVTIRKDLVTQIFYNIPSPSEMALMVKHAGLTFDNELTNPIENRKKYISQNDLALNMGVYGADLSYARIFNQVQVSINYLSVIRDLTDALQIDRSDKDASLENIEKHVNNRDSMLQAISKIYGNVDSYLKENNRQRIAALIVTGGWIEANYLILNSINLDSPDSTILNKIAEQKFSLKSLIKLNEQFAENDNFSVDMVNKLNELLVIYHDIIIVNKHISVSTDNKNNASVIKGKSSIEIDKEALVSIKDYVDGLRKQITLM